MRKIDNFVNLYSLSKTLRFKAIPVGKTQENINIKRLIEEDEDRAEKYKKAKKIIDRYHIKFIDSVLNNVSLEGLKDYYLLYIKSEKQEEEKAELLSQEADYRKTIADAFKNNPFFKTLFEEELIKKVLPEELEDKEEKEIIESFIGFKTAFEGFNQNRVNMYSEEEKSTAIAYRCINENLPKFISNIACFKKICNALNHEELVAVSNEVETTPYATEDFFKIDFFNFVLTNAGINLYNSVIGGIVDKNGKKIKGLNEYINLYNQKLSKQDRNKRLPLLKPLFKQVLAEQVTTSFYISEYENAKELLSDLKENVGYDSKVYAAVHELESIVGDLNEFDLSGIYIKNDQNITELSNRITADWATIKRNWEKTYDKTHISVTVKNLEKYEQSRNKEYKAVESFSLLDLSNYLVTEEKEYSDKDIVAYYSNIIRETAKNIYDALGKISFDNDNSELGDEQVSLIKEYLDNIKEFERIVKSLLGTGKETEKDEVFYGLIANSWERLVTVDSIYNKVRNFVTKKPYSTDKIKLYFQNPQFLGGWDRNKVESYRVTMIRDKGLYYLAVIDKSNSKIFNTFKEADGEDYYEVLDYKLIPGASKQLPHVFFSGKGISDFGPSDAVLKAYKDKTFIKGKSFNINDCHLIIEYYKDALKKHEWGNVYNFKFSNTEEYEDISGFYREVDRQGYKLSFYKVNKSDIDRCVEDGSIYLFQLYNKDFSQYSYGTKNLHTMLFEQLFNEDNGGNIKLCGGAELFLRKASISDKKRIIHPANKEIANKNPLNEKKESLFEYDLIKDKRFTVDQYEIHIPIEINRIPEGLPKLNEEVRKLLKKDENPYIIGIDRGERNLLYVCVINGKGEIVEQFSLNEIINEYNGKTIKTDYHDLLERKEEGRLKSRRDWSTVENIKELKAGYLSQVIHKICTLVIKYDAVIALEDLNSGFKNSRTKVEKQVYQKFEKALIDKLNYLSDKGIEIGENGSITKGFQIANQFKSFKSMGTQNGFIFYIPAWLTSKIDPVTGFADLIKPKYISVEESKKMIENIDDIKYVAEEDMFKFSIDYSKFNRTEADYRKKWDIYTNGERIKTFRNSDKNGEWDNVKVNLTDAFKSLFNRYSINFCEDGLKDTIFNQTGKEFFVEFMGLFKLTLQMRNSITGDTEVDYLISPVKDSRGHFFVSDKDSIVLPQDADANGAYNIARKVLWAIEQFKKAPSDNLGKVKIAISNKEWLEYVQRKMND